MPNGLRRIGFVGLGTMGRPMALNLLRAGYEVRAYDCDEGKLQDLMASGASAGSCPAGVAAGADAIITMLPDSPEVEAVVLGRGGVLEGASPGAILIDMSSILPSVSRQIAGAARVKGVAALDAPVSGGEAGARAGTLSIMVGGDEEIFQRALGVLRVLGKTVVRIGPSGCGSVAKLVNQMIAAVTLAAISEAFVFAVKSEVDPRVLFEAIRGGLAGSAILEAKAAPIFARDFRPSFRLELLLKDLRNALASAAQNGLPAPFAGKAAEALQALVNQGEGCLDCSAMVHYFERSAGVEVR